MLDCPRSARSSNTSRSTNRTSCIPARRSWRCLASGMRNGPSTISRVVPRAFGRGAVLALGAIERPEMLFVQRIPQTPPPPTDLVTKIRCVPGRLSHWHRESHNYDKLPLCSQDVTSSASATPEHAVCDHASLRRSTKSTKPHRSKDTRATARLKTKDSRSISSSSETSFITIIVPT
jgi:hypothetical protein